MQADGHIEWYNKSVVERWRQYVNQHQSSCNLLVQHLTYTYIRQVHRFTWMTPFSLSQASNLPGPTLQDHSNALLHSPFQQVPAKLLHLHILHRLSLKQTKTDKSLMAAQAR